MTREPSYEGGCACGATRFRVSGPGTSLCICHCTSCRRASGAPCVAWGTFDPARFELTRGHLAQYASSRPVVRGFCPRCGSALTYRHRERPQEIDVALASLDDPAALVPEYHIWVSERLPWVVPGDGLPQYPKWRSG